MILFLLLFFFFKMNKIDDLNEMTSSLFWNQIRIEN